MSVEHKCKDFERCGNMADEKYTMDYRDVEPDPAKGLIYWCTSCGAYWGKLEKAIYQKMDQSEEFTEKFAKAVNHAHNEVRKKVN